ncbi:glycogen debranching protein GlgX [Elioraea sp. Yellowstone]|nr:glycogen debranching protein GlgX [Elioraea sp. Yellowstone]
MTAEPVPAPLHAPASARSAPARPAGRPDRLERGAPHPLGAHWDGLGVNIAVFSAHAERIELCLFDAEGRHELARLDLPECTDEIWHGYLPGAGPGMVYGLRAHGPFDPAAGHRFNPHKLLLDPYARQLRGELRWSDALAGAAPRGGRERGPDRRDSAHCVPKCVVTHDDFVWGDDHPPRVPWERTVIYEAHVRGLTMRHPAVPEHQRGTFAGLAHPAVIEHLLRLGITTVELMPVQAILHDRVLFDRGLVNYWGYQTLGFFAPERRYLSAPESRDEIRAAIRRLHQAGIEVILDVVYNHTGEGDETGPTLCWRGLDNASYYRIEAEDRRRYVNHSGTGNTLDLAHPRVLQMVTDSLRHWVTSYHVDGFRFDLASILGREGSGFDPGAGLLDAIRQDPVLAQVKLIAEPWDLGPEGYQLGRFPPGFAEWNDRFRDTVRRFWAGDAEARPELAARLTASAELFDRHRRRPWASVNYVTAHDGFTLHDLTAYARKHNEANGEGNRDGSDHNLSRNWGVEGETDDPAINATREAVGRAMIATLLASAGTPMLLAGDELRRTQKGNNNAYCQDNPLSWIDWTRAEEPAPRRMRDFVARCVALRARLAPLRPTRFLHGTEEPWPGLSDIAWFDAEGRPKTPQAWAQPGHTLVLRRIWPEAGTVQATLLLLNADAVAHRFTLPDPPLDWRRVLDTALPDAPEEQVSGREIEVAAHAAVLLACTLGDKRP